MREYNKSTRRRGSGVWAWPDAVKRLGGGRAMDGAEERDAVTGGRVQVASSRYLSWGGDWAPRCLRPPAPTRACRRIFRALVPGADRSGDFSSRRRI